jgi:hypothetical protein
MVRMEELCASEKSRPKTGSSDLKGVYPQKIPVGSASISASSSGMLPGSMKS